MNIQRLVQAAILTSLLVLLHPAATAQNVRMATSDWEPFFASTLPAEGVVTDIVRTAFKREGHSASLDWYPWLRAMKAVASGEADVAMGAYYTAERAEEFYFSDPLFSVDVGFIALKKSGIRTYSNLDSLIPYRIGVMRGWAYTEAFEAAGYLKKEMLINQVLAVRMLFSERVDIVAAGVHVFKYETSLLKDHSIDDLVVLEPLLGSKNLYMMFSRNIPNYKQLADDFNRGLAKIRADGTFNKLLAKHGFLSIVKDVTEEGSENER